METSTWTALLSRIVPEDADDLDALTAGYDDRRVAPGADRFGTAGAFVQLPGAFKRADAICVGLRVTDALPDAHDRALRLASFAIEQDVEVIVLAHVDATGLERFGFRVERIVGATRAEREACERQVRQFWGIDLVL